MHREKEHVKVSKTAKFQSCWPNTCKWQTFHKTKIKRQMYGSKAFFLIQYFFNSLLLLEVTNN